MKYQATIDDMVVDVEFDGYDYAVPITVNGKTGMLHVVGYLVSAKEDWENLSWEYYWYATIEEAAKCYDYYKKDLHYYEVTISYNDNDAQGKEHLSRYRLEQAPNPIEPKPKKTNHVCKCNCGKQVHSLWEGLEESEEATGYGG